MDNYFETIKKIQQDLLSTVVCRPTYITNCWYINGKWHDSEGIKHSTTIYTYDRIIATRWQEDPDNIANFQKYKLVWAQMLIGHIIYRYEI